MMVGFVTAVIGTPWIITHSQGGGGGTYTATISPCPLWSVHAIILYICVTLSRGNQFMCMFTVDTKYLKKFLPLCDTEEAGSGTVVNERNRVGWELNPLDRVFHLFFTLHTQSCLTGWRHNT